MAEQRPMAGKTCMVTGASRGIGFYTARSLALKGAHVIVIGHNHERGEDAVARIHEADPDASAEFIFTDLMDQAQIRELNRTFRERHDRLDVLVNNVGAYFLQRGESPDGIERTFALNHLSYFLVTNLLLDLIKASSPARIVNVSSNAHRGRTMHFDDLEFERRLYWGLTAYGESKLANLLFTYELDRRLVEEDVTVNALHPGFVNTYIGKQYPLLRPMINLVHAIFAKDPKEGAETSIYLASSPEIAGVSGKYFIDKAPVRSSPESYKEGDARRLWEISESMTGLEG
jgi:NAD(P)-dependent dehydrogenase (short-subunit alcohol dehydrogenase family)